MGKFGTNYELWNHGFEQLAYEAKLASHSKGWPQTCYWQHKLLDACFEICVFHFLRLLYARPNVAYSVHHSVHDLLRTNIKNHYTRKEDAPHNRTHMRTNERNCGKTITTYYASRTLTFLFSMRSDVVTQMMGESFLKWWMHLDEKVTLDPQSSHACTTPLNTQPRGPSLQR